ncbi:MAG: carboxylesterase/lipase family protein [bacterium]
MKHNRIKTRLGKVSGISLGDCHMFLGLRFGAPPVDERRFMPPVAAGAWQGTIDATQWPNRAIQSAERGTMGQNTPGERSEDCLFLNIYTPAGTAGPRPVMVWIHGGGFTAGSANEYDGRVLARQGDVVVVTINYRLGPFGFLNLEPLGKEFAGSASNGIRDMILALNWVQQNIADYGGDPQNVTLFGESAGAIAILALFGAPAADNLYQKAIIHSPGAPAVAPGDKTTHMAERLDVERSALLETLQSMPAWELLKTNLPNGHEIDGTVVTLPAKQTIEVKGRESVPLIVGTNRTEGTLFTPPDTQGEDLSHYEQMLPHVARGVTRGGDTTAYIKGLQATYPDSNAKRLMEQISTDHFRRTAVEVAEVATEAGVGGWLYRFDLDTTIEFREKKMMAPHACEMAFTFNAFADPECHVFTLHDPDATEVRQLAESWSSTLTRFCHTGDPNGGGLPLWAPYDGVRRTVMLLDQVCRIAEDPDAIHRQLWTTALSEHSG